jgi:hypothetical protein
MLQRPLGNSGARWDVAARCRKIARAVGDFAALKENRRRTKIFPQALGKSQMPQAFSLR